MREPPGDGNRMITRSGTAVGSDREYRRVIVWRRLVGRDGRTYDEAFIRNLRWQPTEYLRRYELGHNDVEHVEISEREAAAFIESATTRLIDAR